MSFREDHEKDERRREERHERRHEHGHEPPCVCFCGGVRILTTRGEVEVERLEVGDQVVTASGDWRPIRWIGRGEVDLERYPEAAPVRIAAHALERNRPARDLRVSPAHAICLEMLGEVLVPACALVNGATITREPAAKVEYWHVELDRHDILIAENQPTESFLDMGNRGFFSLSAAAGEPDGDAGLRTHADFCRPFYDSGPIVEAAQARLRARAEVLGWRLEETDPWADVRLEANARLVFPATRNLRARFPLPEGADSVSLVSPAGVSFSGDSRQLGLSLATLAIDDGFGVREIALDDPRLDEGFHACEGAHRWTRGRARLPASLWEGLEGPLTLCVRLAGPPPPRWRAPDERAAPWTPQLAAVA